MTPSQILVCQVAWGVLLLGGMVIAFLPEKWVLGRETAPVRSDRDLRIRSLQWKTKAIFVFAVADGIFLLTTLARFEPRGVDPFALSAANVQRMIIEPEDYASLVSSPVDLNREEVQILSRALDAATPISPNHPSAKWRCQLRIVNMQGESVVVGVSDSGDSSNGVLVYWWSPNMGLNLGTHRCDALGPLLKAIIESREKGN